MSSDNEIYHLDSYLFLLILEILKTLIPIMAHDFYQPGKHVTSHSTLKLKRWHTSELKATHQEMFRQNNRTVVPGHGSREV